MYRRVHFHSTLKKCFAEIFARDHCMVVFVVEQHIMFCFEFSYFRHNIEKYLFFFVLICLYLELIIQRVYVVFYLHLLLQQGLQIVAHLGAAFSTSASAWLTDGLAVRLAIVWDLRGFVPSTLLSQPALLLR
jgi:hypothetical protein